MRMNVPAEPGEVDLRPLSARSVVLSLLLGAHPPELPVRDLVRAVEPFGVGGSTLRAALSRMVAAGDLRRTDAVYGLSDRLLSRQRRQDEAVQPRTRAWRGDWEMVVITATGRGPAERADLRARLAALRLAELREGVWLRPANLLRTLPEDLEAVAQHYTARPGGTAADRSGADTAAADRSPAALAASLWPLDAWAVTARSLLAHVACVDRPADRLTGFAAVVRHLLADPVLPPELLPDDWPGAALRSAYTDYQGELARTVRQHGRTGGETETEPGPGRGRNGGAAAADAR
ncbi:PaaX domain-containing protein, C- domain protein [Streptomyces adustus]|uniref:PaaX domain-containing protein, C-domain protein n=1 Tax=Streptomyces adustus TaxID=1609272 RepID=A0A5N8VHN9_9ACTN|nr:PaaX family transcriptional regulator C-terminal domain-containing protein [Streptomyces adustus]MPY34730.1 PaaX domain-containing protein, C- domain protein [Streptomyces adustus]